MGKTILIVGGGAAGLMAAETCLNAGANVVLAERMPTLGRKVLMAGKSGLNLTFDAPTDVFVDKFDHPRMAEIVRAFPPTMVREWADKLGADSFVGSAGKVFPRAMKASPLLRRWVSDLVSKGLQYHTRWRWIGRDPLDFRFETPDGVRSVEADAVIFALGGGSWARLGSDGSWLDRFPTRPFLPSNVGFDCNWSAHMAPFAGEAMKNIALTSDYTSVGEFVITRSGIEGGAVYAHARGVVDGQPLCLDLLPHMTEEALVARNANLAKASIGNRLRKLGLNEIARALYFECRAGHDIAEIKRLKLPIARPRPLDEAISTRGGVLWDALDSGLMLHDYPGAFCAGEMVDWDAPTGGYLLTGCFAMGRWAAQHAIEF